MTNAAGLYRASEPPRSQAEARPTLKPMLTIKAIAVLSGSAALAFLILRFHQHSRVTRIAELVLATSVAALIVEYFVS